MNTARLLLRRWNDGDLDAARAIYADPEVMRYIPVGPMTDEQIQRTITRMNAEIDERGYGLWAVVDTATGELIGESGLHYLPQTGEVEIAWLYRASAWGKGFATEAAAAILQHAWLEYNLERVICLIDERNERSIAVASRLGLTYRGVGHYYERDLNVYDLHAARCAS